MKTVIYVCDTCEKTEQFLETLDKMHPPDGWYMDISEAQNTFLYYCSYNCCSSKLKQSIKGGEDLEDSLKAAGLI